jgi:aldehyde:ferredoxin oxidoreductase
MNAGAVPLLGKIAHVDLTTGEVSIERPEEDAYRANLGGPGLVLETILRAIPAGADPLGPANVLCLSAGLLTGTQVPGFPRYTVLAKSPLTGALGKSEAGGYWGPELKKAGFAALVVTGMSPRPVYLAIRDDRVEIRPASHLWGAEPKQVQASIREELREPRARVASIGLAAENLSRIAGIGNDLSHFNGRNGMGAVMASKNLKAIAVRGTGDLQVADTQALSCLYREAAELARTHPQAHMLTTMGTAVGMEITNAAGCLPTHDWQRATFSEVDSIGGRRLNEKYLRKRGGCYMCPVRCKRVVANPDPAFGVDPQYGGPEYETMAAFGSNLGISSLDVILKANELCNRYTLDTISAGMTISFAMACFEAGLLTTADTGGLQLRFGNEDILLPLIEDMAHRRRFGAVLADGSQAAAEKIGKGAEELLLTVKGQEVPMHDPRAKAGLGLQYALSPMGADHWFAQHDPFFVTETSPGCVSLAQLGLGRPVPALSLGPDKVRMVAYTSYLMALYDDLGVCVFTAVARSMTGLDTLVRMVRAATGWDTSLWELLKAGERTNTLYRLFNLKQGLTAAQDSLPRRFFTPFVDGPLAGGPALDPAEFEAAVRLYYGMSGWDPRTGVPTAGKLAELGLQEFADLA